MCLQPGSAVLKIDREAGVLYAIRTCGCGEKVLSFSEQYRPNPDLRPADVIAAEAEGTA